MKRCATVVLGLAAMVASRPVAAQAGLGGTWVTEFDIGIRNENGVETSMGKRLANMILTVKGDSVLGTWQVVAEPNTPAPPPIVLKGAISGAKVVLQSEPVERTVRMNDEERHVKLVTSYNFEVKGDALDGTTRVAPVDNSFDPPERPFSAKRVKP